MIQVWTIIQVVAIENPGQSIDTPTQLRLSPGGMPIGVMQVLQMILPIMTNP